MPSFARRDAGAAITGTDIEGNRLFEDKAKIKFFYSRAKKGAKIRYYQIIRGIG